MDSTVDVTIPIEMEPPRSLAWLAWIIARLGGWNCYYKPPGPKNHARRVGSLRFQGHWLHHCGSIKCVNPVPPAPL